MSDDAPGSTGPGPTIAFDDALGDFTFDAGGFDGRYIAGSLLGKGGMGEVHALTDLASGREVAMKIVRADRRDPRALRRFAREARVQAQLEHPSIIPVYDLGRDPGGQAYFTMKRVQGRSLAEVLRDGAAPYSPRKLLTVVARTAMALEYAHARQVLHRDLKPANIMLGAFDEVYVLDWGLAHVRDPDDGPLPGFDPDAASPPPTVGGAASLHGDAGRHIGTPGYQAPELTSARAAFDHRCDVYALGAILFEVLTGESMHRGDDLATIVISTLTTDGASPRARAPTRDIAPELDALVTACTRLDPAARPSRAADVARTIDRYLDGDRDLARRGELADAGADQAARALAALRATGAEDARERGLREVTRALALDPDHPDARRTLVHLLAEPALAAEADAAAAFAPATVRGFQVATRAAGFWLLSYALFVPLVLWMGVRSWPAFVVMATAIVLVVVTTLRFAHRPPPGLRVPTLHLGLSAAALLAGSALFGSLIVVPTVALLTGVGYVSIFDGQHRRVVAVMIGTIMAPLALQFTDVVPPSYRFVDGALVVRPAMTWLPPTATLAFLTSASVLFVALGILYAARLRRGHRALQRRIEIQAWQLARIVPGEARGTMLDRLASVDHR